MASTSVPIQSLNNATTTNDDDNSNASSSYFQKTVCLYDWWLIMAENDFEGKRLAVAGLTSREQQAVRVFSSAPILKRYDVFTLETVDGICVLIKGFINKVRTEENGFPSEVFNHFVFGFPPYWKEYAEKCLGEGFSNEDVSRSTMDCDKLSTDSGSVDDFNELTPNRNKKAVSEEMHDSSDKMDLSHVTDSFHGVEDEYLVNVGSGISNGRSKSTVERFPLTSKNEVHPGSTAGPVNIGVHDDQSDATDPPLSLHSDRNTVNLFDVDIAAQQKHLGHCMTISCERKDISKSDEKGKKTTGGESEREGSDIFNILNDNVNLGVASIESPLPKSTAVYKARRCKFTKAVPLETSGMNLKSSSEKSESPRRNYKDEEKVMLRDGSANFSTIALSLSPEAGKQSKNTNKALKSSIGLGVANQKEDLQIGVSKKETNAKKTSKSRRKTKRKLAYESPVSQGGREKTSFISPESFSFGRSRSGRLLLPTLEFWRNQTPIYDKDRQITGIREGEGLRGVEPSRGSRSEHQRWQRQLP